ncbi:MAG: flagellar motor switch protein FliN [Betaproteobacteria bacterium]|nr:flagellar motor switch protein FliN [Betaproteobacteria bacterium]
MSELATDQAISTDDWAAALNEQNAANADTNADVDGAFEQAHEARAPNPAVFEQFSGSGARTPTRNDIDLVLDIPVQLTVELGRTKLAIRSLLQLAQGSVVELDGLAGEPMDVLVNGCLIAQGEVVVVNEKFGIRLTDVITPSERMKRLGK